MEKASIKKSNRILIKAANLIIDKNASYETAIRNLKPSKSALRFLRSNLPGYLKIANAINYILIKSKCSLTDVDLKLAAYFSIKNNDCREIQIRNGYNDWQRITNGSSNQESLSLKFGFHPELLSLLEQDYSIEILPALLESLSMPAPVSLRLPVFLNHSKLLAEITSKQSIKFQDKSYLSVEAGSFISFSRKKYSGVEFQDFGSQAISHVLQPSHGHRILDLCAGRGGKTLHLADLTADKSMIYATDFDMTRLSQLRRRNNGLYQSIQLIQYSEVEKHAPYDLVLIDAPCSGSGSLRRNPGLALKPVNDKLIELQIIQKELIQKGSKLIKRNGAIVYATCSLLSVENERPVEHFLKHNEDWKLRNVQPLLANCLPAQLLPQGPYLKLNPLDHNTDGFFAARLELKNSIVD